MAYTGEYSNSPKCHYCGESRFQEATRSTSSNRARKRYAYIPIIDRLRLQYLNPVRAQVLATYRARFKRTDRSKLRDVFDGNLYHEFHIDQLGLFKDPRDVSLHMSLDGVQLTNMRHYEVTPVILINLNLPPDERYKVENILASMIIPGPKAPRNLDSYLRPLVDELKELDHGVEITDGRTGGSFTLRAWTIIVTGDGPAISEAIGFKRPGNAIRPCRTCMIEATKADATASSKTRYYVPHTCYDFTNPPLRGSNTTVRRSIELVSATKSDQYSKRFGIVRASILLELRSLHFPLSFPVDVMHCILQNVTSTLFCIWNRTKLPSDNLHNDQGSIDQYLSDKSLEEVGTALASSRRNIPTYLGHTPRRIDSHFKGYKAAEWQAWLQRYGIPLLDERIDDRCLLNFRDLGQIFTLTTQNSIDEAELPVLEQKVVRFVKEYEELYFHGDPQRMPICTVNNHYLLHLPLYVRQCGPARYWWQFPEERYCGVIKPLARSKSHMDGSLTNAVILLEHLHHLRFTRPIVPQLMDVFPAFTGSSKASLTSPQVMALKSFLQSGHFAAEIFKCCQLRRDLSIGSVGSQRSRDINRRNDIVCFHEPGARRHSFAEVFNFIEVNAPERCKLAWVRTFCQVEFDDVKRTTKFQGFGRRRWIKIEWIQSLAGIIEDSAVKFLITDVEVFNPRSN